MWLQTCRTLGDSLVPLLFPVSCKICQQPIETFTWTPICPDCLQSPRPWVGVECRKCGLFLEGPNPLHRTGLCGFCRRNTFLFEQARNFARYEGVLQSLIQRFKYDGLRPLARPLGKFLATAVERFAAKPWDAVLPVPLHRRRQRQRGFNQAELLAAQMSKFLDLPMAAKDCVRVRDTPPQTGLKAAERRKNMARAFLVPRPEKVKSLRVLLIDDVMTTGATVNACTQALLEAGAHGVWVATLARARLARVDIL